MQMREAAGIAAKLARRAGWAPLLVLVLHLLAAGLLRLYDRYSWLDVPMHFCGGIAIAYFFAACFSALPEGAIASAIRPIAEAIAVVSLTATAAVLWEFAEFACDAAFGSRTQLGLGDTILDLAMGITGGVSLVLIRWRCASLGVAVPLRQRD